VGLKEHGGDVQGNVRAAPKKAHEKKKKEKTKNIMGKRK